MRTQTKIGTGPRQAVWRKWYTLFLKAGVFVQTHVLLTNGQCVETYANLNVLLNARGPVLWKLIDTVIDCFVPAACRRAPLNVLFVGVGNGAHFANLIADEWARRYRHLLSEDGSMICYARAERDPMTKRLVFSREQGRFIPGKYVVVIDDVLSSGATMTELCSLVISCGGVIKKAITLFSRGKSGSPRLKIGSRRIQVACVCHKHIPTHPIASCPSCRREIPWSQETPAGLIAFHLGKKPGAAA